MIPNRVKRSYLQSLLPPVEAGVPSNEVVVGCQLSAAVDGNVLELVEISECPVGDGLVEECPDALDRLQLTALPVCVDPAVETGDLCGEEVPMPRALSQDLRRRIVKAVLAGATYEEAAARFEVGRASVSRLMRRNRERGGDLAPDVAGGSRGGLEPADHQVVRELVVEKPDRTLEELREGFEARTGRRSSTSAMSRALVNAARNLPVFAEVRSGPSSAGRPRFSPTVKTAERWRYRLGADFSGPWSWSALTPARWRGPGPP